MCSRDEWRSAKNFLSLGAIDSTVTTIAERKPQRSRWASGREMSGLFATESSALGVPFVSGSIRSPWPPARMTGVISMALGTFVCFVSDACSIGHRHAAGPIGHSATCHAHALQWVLKGAVSLC
jgi:hypothetical protein